MKFRNYIGRGEILCLPLFLAVAVFTQCISDDLSSCPPPQFECGLTVAVDPASQMQIVANASLKSVGGEDEKVEIEDLTLYLFGKGGFERAIGIPAGNLTMKNGLLVTREPVKIMASAPDSLDVVVWGNIHNINTVTPDPVMGTPSSELAVMLSRSGGEVCKRSAEHFYGRDRIGFKNSDAWFVDAADTVVVSRAVSSITITAYGLEQFFGAGSYDFIVRPTYEGISFDGRLTGADDVAYRPDVGRIISDTGREGFGTGLCHVMPGAEHSDLEIDIMKAGSDVCLRRLRVEYVESGTGRLLAPNRTLNIVIGFDKSYEAGLSIRVTVADWGDVADQHVDWK